MEESDPDFISRLPPDVLLHVVSLIPLKEAIRTSVLSNAWRKLWRPFPVKLDFDSTQLHCIEATEELKQIIAASLRSYHYPSKLELWLHSGELLAVVTKGTQRELYFDFSGPENVTNTTKFNLIFERGNLNPTSSTFSSLKSLQLRFVTHVTQNFVADLSSSCEFLESLSLEKCSGLQSIDLRANNCLKILRIVDCSDVVKITLSAPTLTTFLYRGVLPNFDFITTPQLVEVALNLTDSSGHKEFDCEDALSLLFSLRDVEILTISGWILEWLCTSGVVFGWLEFELDKLKELWWIDSVMNKCKRDSFACFLNITPNLERLFVRIDPKRSAIPAPIFLEYWHEPHLWMDYETVKCDASPLKHLKIVKLMGFSASKEDEVLLMDLLLHKAVNLKHMTIISPENEAWRVAVIPKSQVNHVLRRHEKHTLLPSPNSHSLYLLTESKDSL